MRIACLMMLKDERMLAPCFLRYHAALFGAENIYVFDNGSSDSAVIAELQYFESIGGNVDWRHITIGDFQNKGAILGNAIQKLDAARPYDLYIPLDCDEFVLLRSDQGLTADPKQIRLYLQGVEDTSRILRVTENLPNLLGYKNYFRTAPYEKTIWRRGTFFEMDMGYHSGSMKDGRSEYQDCRLVYAHYHYRPYEEVVAFTRRKLQARLSDEQISDSEQLRAYRGMGWHLAYQLLDGEKKYYEQFQSATDAIRFTGLSERFYAVGCDAPFADFCLPLSGQPRHRAPDIVVDEATTKVIRGWAVDLNEPETPLFLSIFIGGVLVWQGDCDHSRPDVGSRGRSSDRAGFSFTPPHLGSTYRTDLITIQDRNGLNQSMMFNGEACSSLSIEAR